MAIAENKQCHSCGLFWDCEKYNGKHTPPCAELAEKNFNSLQLLKECHSLLCLASQLLELHCPNHKLVDKIEHFLATASI